MCLFSLEVIQALRMEGHTIVPGSSGENFTLAEVDWGRIQPGIVLQIGDSLRLEVTTYTAPCQFNAQWFTTGDYGRISQKLHPGWSRVYARVLREGMGNRETASALNQDLRNEGMKRDDGASIGAGAHGGRRAGTGLRAR